VQLSRANQPVRVTRLVCGNGYTRIMCMQFANNSLDTTSETNQRHTRPYSTTTTNDQPTYTTNESARRRQSAQRRRHKRSSTRRPLSARVVYLSCLYPPCACRDCLSMSNPLLTRLSPHAPASHPSGERPHPNSTPRPEAPRLCSREVAQQSEDHNPGSHTHGPPASADPTARISGF